MEVLKFYASPILTLENINSITSNVHLMRMEAKENYPCDTSPKGLHKDGENFICVYLLNKSNVKGGINCITDNNKNILDQFSLDKIGESYIIKDEMVWHSLSPVECKDESSIAIRDTLLIDFIID
jgi:hypothetical protein